MRRDRDRGWAGALAAVALLAAAETAAAQDAAAVARGGQLLAVRRYGEAAAVLERAVAAQEAPPALFNLALAYRGVGRYRDAIARFERFLAVARDPRYAARRAQATGYVRELRAALARVTLRVSGGAAAVTADGVGVAAGDGAHEVTLDPGPHVFEARREGHAPARAERSLTAGEQAEVALDAAAALARVTLRVTGGAARVYADGREVAAGDGAHEVTLDPGPHVFEARREGHAPARAERSFTPGEQAEVALDAGASPLPASLVVRADARDARVLVDGRPAPDARRGVALALTLAPGAHPVELRAPGRAPWRETLALLPGARHDLRWVVAAPADGASVFGRWWFWTGVGVLAVGVTVAVVALLAGGTECYASDGAIGTFGSCP